MNAKAKSPLLLSILTGLFIGTSYIPFPPWAILFGIAPLVVAWVRIMRHQQDAKVALKTAFFVGWLAQFILNNIGFHWIANTAIEFGHFPTWAGVLTLLGFSSIAHLYYAIAGTVAMAIQFRLQRRGRPLGDVGFVALVFSLFALSEALWPSIFPWHLGYPWLWANLPGAQFADVIGFEGLNLVCLITNGLIAIGWLRYKPEAVTFSLRSKPARNWVVSALALFLLINVLGMNREKSWRETDKELRLLAVQGNIGNYEKLIVEKNKDFAIPIVNKYLELTSLGLTQYPETQFAIWPETAFPSFLDALFQNQNDWIALRGFIQTRKIGLLTGAYSYDQVKKETYNGFFAMSPQGTLFGVPYRKSILIPFGEKFPFSDYIPYMKWLFPGLGSFGQGPGPSVMDVGQFLLGPQICLESLYPAFSASMARQGAEIISNVTNDSWFGRTFEPYQHMTMTLARAIETRRPLLRATNTGITTVILADGTTLERSPIDQEWFGYFRIPYKSRPPVTFYSYIAGFTPWLALVTLLSLLGFALKGPDVVKLDQ